MQFSLIFEAQMAEPTRANERQVIEDSVEQAVLADRLGFDRVWAVEHHCLLQYAHMSAPEVFLTYVAARTERIRLGHGVVCLPFAYNHPIRVAERAAMLDILSGGRLDVGAGRGATEQETGAFGIVRDQTQAELEESLAMLPRIWTEELFEWHGDLLDVPPRTILPRPVQDPHPPLFLACTRESTLNLAAELGVGALTLGFAGPDDIAAKRSTYDAARARRDGSRFVSAEPNDHLSALCPAVVLDDAEEARRIGFRGQRFFTEAISRWHRQEGGPTPETWGDDNDRVLAERGEALVAYISEERLEVGTESTGLYETDHAYGTPADALEYVGRLVDAGADEVMFILQMGTIPHEVVLQTIQNLADHVIPAFR